MKILLSHGYFLTEDEREKAIMKPYPPLGILYISAWLDKHNVVNTVFDTTFSTMGDFKKYLLSENPKILALYTNLVTKLNIIEIINFVKSKSSLSETIVVLGGPDIRYNVEDYLSTKANVVVIGEGEQTMLEIANSVKNGNCEEFAHIDGLAYLSGGRLIVTKERSRIRPIDDIPLPNRHKINMQLYLDVWKENHGKSAMTVSTQRGCPYTCKWCSTAVYGQSYRRRSPHKLVEELKFIKATYNPDTIWFVDDVFTVSHKWLEEFKNLVNEENCAIPFECITRADRMNEEVIGWLKEAGCFRVWIGAESGSQKIIDLMDRRVDVNQVRKMIQLSAKNGIEAGTFIMLGYPGETEEDIQETVQHLKESNPEYFTITIAYPIKGTSLYNEVESIQTGNLNWMESTDRDRDFKRSFSIQYYKQAVKWVENEVRYYQAKKRGSAFTKKAKFKMKSIIAKAAMNVLR